jgi:hypothetical protein
VQLTDLAEWHPVKLPPDACDPWFDQLASPVEAASTLHFCMPHQVLPGLGRLMVNYLAARGRAADRDPGRTARSARPAILIAVTEGIRRW